MNTQLEILLVEDDQYTCKEFITEIDNNSDEFNLIGVTNNSARAYQYVTESYPDVVILDLELHHGSGDGIEFLKSIKESQLLHIPFILVTTNNISTVIHTAARELGADFIMTKSQEGYSVKGVLDFLKITKDTIKRRKIQIRESSQLPILPESNKRLQRIISNEILKIGINPKSIGYKYLVDAIALVIKGQVQHLCNVIGKKYGKSEDSVERAMQNAINRAWNTSDINDLLSNYTAKIRSDKGVPTVTEFIFYYAQKIQNEY